MIQNSCLLSGTRQEANSASTWLQGATVVPCSHHALNFRQNAARHHIAQCIAEYGDKWASLFGHPFPWSIAGEESVFEEIMICALMLPGSAHMLSRHRAFSRACQRSGVMHSYQKEPYSALLFCRCAHCVKALGAVSTSTPMHLLAGRCMGPLRCTKLRACVQTCTLHRMLGHRHYQAGDQSETDCFH